MRFTIATPNRLLQAEYVPAGQRLEFSDGRAPLRISCGGPVLDTLQRAFPDCWIMDQHGRSHPPAEVDTGCCG